MIGQSQIGKEEIGGFQLRLKELRKLSSDENFN